jgi:PIN domain nuclease of toxin-antitoxin system
MLIDTQSFIWFVENNPRLPLTVKVVMEESAKLALSIVSLWEITIKISLGKLVMSGDIATTIDKALANGFEILPVERNHLITLSTLDFIHRDPFDRLIISQAIAENVSVVSCDSIFQQYPVNVIWQ